MKRVLMIAYHFPPLAGSSGIQRTLRFVQHLPALGWEPMVLTRASPRLRAHQRRFDGGYSRRDRGRARVCARYRRGTFPSPDDYPAFLARPDRWMTWRLGAVPAGMRLIRERRPDVIWSTYPIATAHVIGDVPSSTAPDCRGSPIFGIRWRRTDIPRIRALGKASSASKSGRSRAPDSAFSRRRVLRECIAIDTRRCRTGSP